jgi:imidazolonepropionase-like amidohydrolase
MTYRINSHSDAQLSRLDGTTYGSMRAAREAIRTLRGATYAVRCNGGLVLYSTRADMHTDRDGGAQHLAVATIDTDYRPDNSDHADEDWE